LLFDKSTEQGYQVVPILSEPIAHCFEPLPWWATVRHGKLNARDRQSIAALHDMAEQTGGADFDTLHTDLSQDFAGG
jgi:hypothetical protein